MFIKKCLICGKDFSIISSRKNAKYCSYRCYWESLRGKSSWSKGRHIWSGDKRKNLVIPNNKGRILSEETKMKISKAHRGMNLSEEHKKKLSKAQKGKKRPYISERNKLRVGNKAFNWKGGKFKSGGYWLIYQPIHLKAIKKYVKQCILVAEKYLERPLTKLEIVHHINNIKNDDNPQNLYLFPNQLEHFKYHRLKNPYPLKSNLL